MKLWGVLLLCLFTGCAQLKTGFCNPNAQIQDTAKGTLLGVATGQQVSSAAGTATSATLSVTNMTFLGAVLGTIVPNVWNFIVTSGCGPTTPVEVAPAKAQISIVPASTPTAEATPVK